MFNCAAATHKSIKVNLSKAPTMPYVEIWKSKHSWDLASAEEQSRILKTLAELIQPHTERKDEKVGPFLPCKDTGCALVWEVRPDRADMLKKDYERVLGYFFEPLMFGLVQDLTAKDCADRLEGKTSTLSH